MLADLLAGSLADAEERRATVDLAAVEVAALSMSPARDAHTLLSRTDRVHIIAEIKRASPSRGAIAAIADPVALAQLYEEGGASAISVLTESRRFAGSLDDLRAVAARSSVPILRKDFIAEPYQIFEARAAGADMVLLIVAALDQATLAALFRLVSELGMTALVETHSSDEVRRALDVGATIIGVNARDLNTFELDRRLFGSVVGLMPETVTRVAESAVLEPADVAHYRQSGADVVLVGEALVTTGDPVARIREFVAS